MTHDATYRAYVDISTDGDGPIGVVTITRDIPAGVCGPWEEWTFQLDGLAWGYLRAEAAKSLRARGYFADSEGGWEPAGFAAIMCADVARVR